jgi:hypothetical protein
VKGTIAELTILPSGEGKTLIETSEPFEEIPRQGKVVRGDEGGPLALVVPVEIGNEGLTRLGTDVAAEAVDRTPASDGSGRVGEVILQGLEPTGIGSAIVVGEGQVPAR